MEAEGRLVPATVADHIEPHHGDLVKFRGPLQSLCATCHSSRKQQLERSGFVRGHDLAGVPLDPGHPWRQEIERERAGCTPGAVGQGQESALCTPDATLFPSTS